MRPFEPAATCNGLLIQALLRGNAALDAERRQRHFDPHAKTHGRMHR
jgi:hypothetical protein